MIPDQFFLLITPVAIATAIASGIAFALVIRALRPAADEHLIVYLTLVMSLLWYGPQFAALFLVDGTGWATLGRWTLFLGGFVLPMWLVLRWRKR